MRGRKPGFLLCFLMVSVVAAAELVSAVSVVQPTVKATKAAGKGAVPAASQPVGVAASEDADLLKLESFVKGKKIPTTVTEDYLRQAEIQDLERLRKIVRDRKETALQTAPNKPLPPVPGAKAPSTTSANKSKLVARVAELEQQMQEMKKDMKIVTLQSEVDSLAKLRGQEQPVPATSLLQGQAASAPQTKVVAPPSILSPLPQAEMVKNENAITPVTPANMQNKKLELVMLGYKFSNPPSAALGRTTHVICKLTVRQGNDFKVLQTFPLDMFSTKKINPSHAKIEWDAVPSFNGVPANSLECEMQSGGATFGLFNADVTEKRKPLTMTVGNTINQEIGVVGLELFYA